MTSKGAAIFAIGGGFAFLNLAGNLTAQSPPADRGQAAAAAQPQSRRAEKAELERAGQQQRGEPLRGTGQSQSAIARRRQLEERFRQRTGDLVRRRLQLTDDQMIRLQTTNRQFEQQRIALLARERELRRELRQQLVAGDNADQGRVGELLDQTIRLQRQRLDLADSEQRELAKFLKPVQRAKYFGLQNELRRRMQEVRDPGAQRSPKRRRQARPIRPAGLN